MRARDKADVNAGQTGVPNSKTSVSLLKQITGSPSLLFDVGDHTGADLENLQPVKVRAREPA